ncbi:MAG TPA: hypothetical protein VMK13_16045 [Streptosporangiaceae bacterium]|nr:hypothetical protein [Streptosporangiaceae bacterium]
MPDLDNPADLPLPDLAHVPLPASRQVIHAETFRSRVEAVHRFNDKLGPLGWRLFTLTPFFAAHQENATEWVLIVSRDIPG